MAATLQNQLETRLAETLTPWGAGSVAAGLAKPLQVLEGGARVRLQLGYSLGPSASRLQELVQPVVAELTGNDSVSLDIDSAVQTHKVQGTLTPIKGVKNIIAVSSAKGGVGKSTVAANLALALQYEGASVGMLDADIYGPSQPIMLGVEGQQPVSRDGKTFEPIEALGLKMMSVGCLVDTGQPMVWRGPMVTQALNQMLFTTNWGELDYLIIDMPPGTGDIQLTLGQKVPVSGAVIVTTPQDIALADAIRGLRMFEKVSIPVLGLVENMSSFACPHCGEVTPLFGAGGGADAAKENNLSLLGVLPLDLRIRVETDSGKPTVLAEPDSAIGLAFRDLALNTVSRLAERPKDGKGAFAGIGVTTE